jgi:peptidyl-tRNA hydrolase
MPDPIKQVVIVNMASPMSIGRLAVQAMHASTLGILARGNWEGVKFTVDATDDFALEKWLKKQFTVTLHRAWGENHLLGIMHEAEGLGIHVAVMEEDGEMTAIALGPDFTEKFAFTEFLPLF